MLAALPRCHDEVWEADAVEFYMSLQPDLADNHQNVTEIDISALDGGLWGGWINNSDGYLPAQPNPLIPCSASVRPACAYSVSVAGVPKRGDVRVRPAKRR